MGYETYLQKQQSVTSWSQVNESNENHYPSDDPEIAVDERSIPEQEKCSYLVVTLAGSGLKSAQKDKITS
ncbi:hypothetical protein DAPPUDRAFT_322432 [Daphnia pulex]|uniref:Uncharacterized protein n=1 Tax=Daphnia pulex TaxID=6669 RepID=E9GVY4_DAPPU|nr:hypothetical protein DAPPUDRAFT_322432 [Daphnia pulex]|eukprot:EFX76366.1 hypothetical protein DAPPUDRAFT_322432 [Daphnia pulex]